MNRYRLHEPKTTSYQEIDPFDAHMRLRHRFKESTFLTLHERAIVKGQPGYMACRDWDQREISMTVEELKEMYEPL